jgi:hypothetical protein
MDFPILAFQSVANVRDIALFGGGGSLDIQGSDFTGAAAILINGYRAPTFVVLSDTRLLADLPATQIGVPIRSVSVIRRTTQNSESTIISFEAMVPSPAITEATYLVQRVLKNLLTTPGSDIFSPRSGGGLLSLLGPIPVDTGAIFALVSLRVKSTVEELVEQQARDLSTPPEQRLSGIEILEAEYSAKDTALDVRLRIISSSGASIVAGVVL